MRRRLLPTKRMLRRVAMYLAYRVGVTNGEYARYFTRRVMEDHL